MSFRAVLPDFSPSTLLAKGTGVLGLTALAVLACNGRLDVLEPAVTDDTVGSAGSSSVDVVNHNGDSDPNETVADAGPVTPAPDAAQPEPSPCTCSSSPQLMALGCGTAGVSGAPLISDDGQTVTFDLCDDNSFCQPYRWTAAGGVVALPVPVQGGTVSHLSPDGDTLVISPMDTFGAEALVYRASDGSTVGTGLLPSYANLALSAQGSIVGLTRGGSGATQLTRWTRDGGRDVLGELPYDPSNVLLAGSPDAAVIVGVNHGPSAANELFRWTPEQGLEIEPQELAPVLNGSGVSLSRNGAAVGAYLAPESGSSRIVRWTASGLTELTTTPASSLSALAISADGAVLAGSSFSTDVDVCELNPLNCTQYFSAFRWTEAGGLQVLTPGAASTAAVLSADGSLVIGQTHDGVKSLFSWTAERGARNIQSDLAELGVDLSDWELAEPRAIAGNARVVVGYGRCGTGSTIYRLEVPGEPPPN